jgi:hypothetical protein
LKPNERNNGSKTSLFDEFGLMKKPGKKIRKALAKKNVKLLKSELKTALLNF